MPRRSKISQTSTTGDQAHHGILFVEGIPLTTKTEFKATCARQEESMRDVIIRIMREYVAKHVN